MVLYVAAVGVSGSGKTTTLEYLIGRFTELGYRVGAVKHIHHEGFTMDKVGSNTWRFGHAGAKVVVAVSPDEVAVIKKTDGQPQDLDAILNSIKRENLDIVFIEGFHGLLAKRADIYKIVTAKDQEGLKAILEGTVEPVLAASGLIGVGSQQKSIGSLQLVKIPDEGETLVAKIEALLKTQRGK